MSYYVYGMPWYRTGLQGVLFDNINIENEMSLI